MHKFTSHILVQQFDYYAQRQTEIEPELFRLCLLCKQRDEQMSRFKLVTYLTDWLFDCLCDLRGKNIIVEKTKVSFFLCNKHAQIKLEDMKDERNYNNN